MPAGQSLRGFVGQGMAGRKSYRDAVVDLVGAADATSGASVITAPRTCWALIYMFGPGASGGANGGASGAGGGGGALFKRIRMLAGQTISYAVGTLGASPAGSATNGNSATDTTVTLPTGVILTAGGGKANVGIAGGLGGIATGGDINRSGGAGGSNVAAAGTAGSPGAFGAAGGAPTGAESGGGGGAGFSDIGLGLPGGVGSDGSVTATAAGANYGGGSGSSQGGNIPGPGGSGRVVIWLIRPR